MATKIYGKGGFIAIDQGAGINYIPINSFDFGLKAGDTEIGFHDLSKSNVVSYSDTIANIQNEAGASIGSADVVLAYISNISSGVSAPTLGFKTTTLLVDTEVFDSGIISIGDYSQVQTSVVSDKNGTIDIEFYEDAEGAVLLRALSIPYLSVNGFETFATVCFTDYVKYKFTCTEAGQALFFYETKLFKMALSPQMLDLKSAISSGMLGQLNRSVIAGIEGDGNYANVTVVETSNDAGVYHSLQVVNGARPSQIFGRTPVSIVIDAIIASGVLRATTANKIFYATDVTLTVDNSAAVAGILKLRNGIIAAQPVVDCFLVADPPGAASSNTVLTITFNEPLQFDTGVWADIAAGTLIVCGVINGYEE